MAGYTHGMNTDNVRELASKIDSTASDLRLIDSSIERVMSDLARQWDGPDSQRFRSWWRDQHRPSLHRLVDSIEGLARSARYNVDDQDRASETGNVAYGGLNSPTPSAASPSPEPVGDRPQGGDSLVGSEADLERDFYRDWENRGGNDQWNFGYDTEDGKGHGNCTSYVAWRLNQVAEARGLGSDYFTNNDIGDRHVGRLGDAYEWSGNAESVGIETTAQAQAGAVAWWNKEDISGGFGHVGIVRSVEADGTIVIEESAWNSYGVRVRSLSPGDAGYPTGFMSMLPS